ncbi:aminotransferase class V-fold PLP-dependent enzyme [Bacterioplanoides sp. SCSIO 12839]|uniref:aminotransferase class V-fold PLP-dependent enzyme n=1 Tax=Bacterioplanoides sp. SCSIO 12839 TaxID=2829569 RepID=UPI0021038596|nr:aminotransferase class V-fold PLP-dependent enzyme [Bacterioplanoides sp. SCSIO 12839]UTW49910.1 aminotransferase class V-fold PLP-dependent enzyme [Bacterioplanoides sp. SCSIO 12839]
MTHSSANNNQTGSGNNETNGNQFDWRAEFPVNDECMYLNHAAVAPWPESARKAVANFAAENVAMGASHYPEWMQVEKSLKRNLEQLIDAPKGSVALVKNTSEALSFVAYGLEWQAGDVVVISDQEFPSNRIVWESLQNQGVKVVEVALPYSDPEAELLAAIAQKPKLVSISAVQYASGLRLDINRIGQACRDNGVLFCIDAIQAVGAQAFSVQENLCDFAMADGHKWMLGPEGLGLFYVRAEIMDQLQVREFGWHMVEDMGNYNAREWQLASDARRFECGSPNLLASYALEASTGLLLKAGLPQVEYAISERVQYLKQGLAELEANFVNPLLDERPSGILTFHFWGADSQKLYQALMKTGVICANRGGGVRFSPHFHTTQDALDDALEAVEEMLPFCQS